MAREVLSVPTPVVAPVTVQVQSRGSETQGSTNGPAQQQANIPPARDMKGYILLEPEEGDPPVMQEYIEQVGAVFAIPSPMIGGGVGGNLRHVRPVSNSANVRMVQWLHM